MKLGDLFIKLGFQADENAVSSFQQQVIALSTSFMAAVQAAELAYDAIDGFVNGTIRGTTALMNFNQQTDLSVDKLQKWQASAQLANIEMSAEQVTSSIQALQQNLAQIRLGGGNIAPFQLLGIDVMGKDAFEVIEQIRQAIDGLDSATAVNLIKQTGLSPGFINVLRQSEDSLNSLNSELYPTARERETIEDFGQRVNKLGLQFGFLKDKIVADLIPILNRALDFFKNIGFIVKQAADAVTKFVQSWDNLKIALIFSSVYFAGIAASIFPITAALTSLLLILEDISVYMQGGKSVFGELVEISSKAIESIGNFMQEHIITPIQGVISDLTSTMQIMSEIGNMGSKVFSGIGGNQEINAQSAVLPPPPQINNTRNESQVNNTQNNEFNINSNVENPVELANELQPILSGTMQQINNSGY